MQANTAKRKLNMIAVSPDDGYRFIRTMSLALSRADDQKAVAKVGTELLIDGVGASAGAIAINQAAQFSLAYSIGYPPDTVSTYQSASRRSKLPLFESLHSGEPIFVESLVEQARLYPLLSVATLAGRSMAVLPLVAQDIVLGAISVSFAEDRDFTTTDRLFLQAAAQVVAQALARQREIDDRRQAEDVLAESEMLKATILEAALDCVITIDEVGRVVDWNPAAERTFGFSRHSAVGCLLSELVIPPSQRQAHAQGIERFLTTGNGPLLSRRVEVTALTASGAEIPIELTILPIRLKDSTLFTAYARDLSERQRIASTQWHFVRDMLRAVTDEKFHLCDSEEELPRLGTPVCQPIHLSRASGIAELRQSVRSAASDADLPCERRDDITTASSEAAMNAVVHAGEGFGQVFVDADSRTVGVKVWDQGSGITIENLPQATLRRGFSTNSTLGHGLKMMIETADRVYLITGANGTVVVLQQMPQAPIPAWLEPETVVGVPSPTTASRA